MTKLRAAGLVVFRRVHEIHEFLLLQTSYGTHHWTPPKGTYLRSAVQPVQPAPVSYRNQNYLKSAMQFNQQVTSIKVKLKWKQLAEKQRKNLGSRKYEVKGVPKSVVYWLAEICKDIPIKLSSEHQDFKWLPLKEACDLVVYDEMKLLLKDCSTFLADRISASCSYPKDKNIL